MEAARELGSPPQPGTRKGDSRTLTLTPSPGEKGFFYPDYHLPDYESEVIENEIAPLGAPKKQDDFGTTYLEKWAMDDEHGTRYKVMRCLAAKPLENSVWVVKDTAWSMQPEGVNEDIARKFMKLGFNVLIKGPEIGSSIPQSQTAYNMHKVLDTLHQRGDMDANSILAEGYSRGAMVGFGTNAYAEKFGRRVLYSNFTDPCVAVGIGVNRETVEKAVTLSADITLLGLAIAKGLTDPKRTGSFLHTVDLSPEGGRQFIRTGKPLMNGEAGKLADATPLDMQATIAFFRRCRVNDEKRFREILANRPGVRFVRPEGGHGGALDSRIIGNIAVRFGRLGQQLAEGRSPDELDYQQITYGSESTA